MLPGTTLWRTHSAWSISNGKETGASGLTNGHFPGRWRNRAVTSIGLPPSSSLRIKPGNPVR
jgi:hypothetical protein